MKTKLLKKLRKRNVIEVRNKKYRVVDRKHISAEGQRTTAWIGSLRTAISIRRDWILDDARLYFKPKKIIK